MTAQPSQPTTATDRARLIKRLRNHGLTGPKHGLSKIIGDLLCEAADALETPHMAGREEIAEAFRKEVERLAHVGGKPDSHDIAAMAWIGFRQNELLDAILSLLHPAPDVREALEPFALLAELVDTGKWLDAAGFTLMHHHEYVGCVTLEDIRRAKAAYDGSSTPTQALDASREGELQLCPGCGGDGHVGQIQHGCCGLSQWECGGRGCTGPVPVNEQIQCRQCQGTGCISTPVCASCAARSLASPKGEGL